MKTGILVKDYGQFLAWMREADKLRPSAGEMGAAIQKAMGRRLTPTERKRLGIFELTEAVKKLS